MIINTIPTPADTNEARNSLLTCIALLRGRGIEAFPDTLAFSIHKGIDLENEQWQQRLMEDIKRHEFEYVIFDPIRRYASCADKGPSDVMQVTRVLRQIVTNTGCTIDLVHHDVKPPKDGHDQRRRSHRASGGDWFAASECPVRFETIGNDTSLVIPEDYKFTVDPAPFKVTYVTDCDGVRLVGENLLSCRRGGCCHR